MVGVPTGFLQRFDACLHLLPAELPPSTIDESMATFHLGNDARLAVWEKQYQLLIAVEWFDPLFYTRYREAQQQFAPAEATNLAVQGHTANRLEDRRQQYLGHLTDDAWSNDMGMVSGTDTSEVDLDMPALVDDLVEPNPYMLEVIDEVNEV